MSQEGIGQAGKRLPCLGIVLHQWFATRIGTGHHQRDGRRLLQPGRTLRPAKQLMEQQVMQRRIRQHQADT